MCWRAQVRAAFPLMCASNKYVFLCVAPAECDGEVWPDNNGCGQQCANSGVMPTSQPGAGPHNCDLGIRHRGAREFWRPNLKHTRGVCIIIIQRLRPYMRTGRPLFVCAGHIKISLLDSSWLASQKGHYQNLAGISTCVCAETTFWLFLLHHAFGLLKTYLRDYFCC
jgi:hypothetical protein